MELKHSNLIQKMKIETKRCTEYDDNNYYEETRIVSILGYEDEEITDYTIEDTLATDLPVILEATPRNSLEFIADKDAKQLLISTIKQLKQNYEDLDWDQYGKLKKEGKLPPLIEDLSADVYLAMAKNGINLKEGYEALVAFKDTWPSEDYIIDENRCKSCNKFPDYINYRKAGGRIDKDDICECDE